MGSPGSRVKCFRTCYGVSDRAGSKRISRYRSAPYCLPLVVQRQHPELWGLHGSIPGPHVPLSTLQPRHYWRHRMTRGRCGSLHLHRIHPLHSTGFNRRFHYVPLYPFPSSHQCTKFSNCSISDPLNPLPGPFIVLWLLHTTFFLQIFTSSISSWNIA